MNDEIENCKVISKNNRNKTMNTTRTVRQTVCIKFFRVECSKIEDSHEKVLMQKDLANLERLSSRVFLTLLDKEFEGFTCRSTMSMPVLKEFSAETNRRKEIASKFCTSVVVKTDKCSSCGRSHFGYIVKVDNRNQPYVICGSTKKRINIYPQLNKFNDFKQLRAMKLAHFEVEKYDSTIERDVEIVKMINGESNA